MPKKSLKSEKTESKKSGATASSAKATRAPKASRGPKASKGSKKGRNIFEDDDPREASTEEELPKDEAGRRKIKRQYEDLLGIRIQKLRGRILNRERINKTIEGIYFICAECAKVCHNVDDGLTEDPDNVRNLCGACTPKPRDTKGKSRQAAA